LNGAPRIKKAGHRRFVNRSPRPKKIFLKINLCVYKPVLIHNFLHSVRLLADVIRSFVHYCLSGLNVDRAKIDYFVIVRPEAMTAPDREVPG
jgi:hypothetical protein